MVPAPLVRLGRGRIAGGIEAVAALGSVAEGMRGTGSATELRIRSIARVGGIHLVALGDVATVGGLHAGARNGSGEGIRRRVSTVVARNESRARCIPIIASLAVHAGTFTTPLTVARFVWVLDVREIADVVVRIFVADEHAQERLAVGRAPSPHRHAVPIAQVGLAEGRSLGHRQVVGLAIKAEILVHCEVLHCHPQPTAPAEKWRAYD